MRFESPEIRRIYEEAHKMDEARKLAHRVEEAIRDGAAEYWRDAKEEKSKGDLPSYITRAVLAVLPGQAP